MPSHPTDLSKHNEAEKEMFTLNSYKILLKNKLKRELMNNKYYKLFYHIKNSEIFRNKKTQRAKKSLN